MTRSFDLGRVPSSAVSIAVWTYLAFVLVTVDVVLDGPFRRLDRLIAGSSWQQSSAVLDGVAWWLDHVGLRGLTAPILLVAAVVISRRIRTWRPFVLAVVGLLALNLSAGTVKVLVGRTSPRTGVDDLLAGGFAYVSGHAANAALTWGLLAYLMHRFTSAPARVKSLAVRGAAAVTVVMVLVSLYRNTHWLTDLVGGVLVGATLLALIAVLDHGYPTGPDRGPRPQGTAVTSVG